MIERLRERGVEQIVMLTGDNERVAQYIADELGIDEVYAELLPEEKVTHIEMLQDRHEAVAMVGDGVNDAPALATADISIGMGGAGTDVALETADIVLMSDKLDRLPYAFALSRETRRMLYINFAIAFGLIAIMVVAILTAGIPLPVAVVGHEGSTVLVSLIGLRLLRYDGIHADVTDVDFADIVREVNEEVSSSSDSIRNGVQTSNQHTLFEGEGRFIDDRTVEITDGMDDGKRARADTVLVAAGTRPAIPPIDGIETADYLTSREALQLETPPDDLVIVGVGYIAAELAHFFGTFGSDISIIGRRRHLLPAADEEVAAAFTERYADRFEVHTGYEAVTLDESDGALAVEARPYPPALDDPSDREDVTVTGDTLLVAAGRRPNTDRLGLEATGVETDELGFVKTDEYLRTTADGIWALGDIVGEYLLKHNANHEARTVIRNLLGDDLEPIDYTAMPFAVFGSPEVAGVGTREQELHDTEREYATATYRYEYTARGKAMKADGFVKVLIEPGGEILGCHIVGPDASTLIEEVVVAMNAGTGTVWDIRESVHVHSALSEVVDRAFSGQFTRHGADAHDHSHQHEHDHDHHDPE